MAQKRGLAGKARVREVVKVGPDDADIKQDEATTADADRGPAQSFDLRDFTPRPADDEDSVEYWNSRARLLAQIDAVRRAAADAGATSSEEALRFDERLGALEAELGRLDQPLEPVTATPSASPIPAAPVDDEDSRARLFRSRDAMDGAINQAIRRANDPGSNASIWVALTEMARQERPVPPMKGYVEGEGIQYEGDKPEFKYLTKSAFYKRMAARREAAGKGHMQRN